MESKYLLLPAIIAVLFALVSFYKPAKTFLEKNSIFSNLLLSILGAYIGVFAGTYFSNAQSAKNELDSYKRLLNASAKNVQASIKELDNVFVRLDTFLKEIGADSLQAFTSVNKLSAPDLAIKILSSNEVLKNISEPGILYLSHTLDNVTHAQNAVKESIDDFEAHFNSEIYRKTLLFLDKILHVEVALMEQNKYQPQDIEKVYKVLRDKIFPLPVDAYKALTNKTVEELLRNDK